MAVMKYVCEEREDDDMERLLLVAARARKHWTLKEAADRVGVNVNTLLRWEKNLATPHAYNIQRLCEVYEVPSWELGLDQDIVGTRAVSDATSINTVVMATMKYDLTMHLFTIVSDQRTYQEIQYQVRQTLEDYDAMNRGNEAYRIKRREALQRLATWPFAGSLYLSTPEIDVRRPTDEIVAKCAASIAACWELSKSTDESDLAMAFQAVSAYIPSLNAIARDSSQYRHAATNLLAQCYLFKTVLGWHLESLDRATEYAQQAMQYGEETDDLPLQITIHTQLSWIYYYAKRQKRSLEEIQRAAYLLKHSSTPMPPGLQSSVQSTLAIRQAMHGQRQQALTSLRVAHERFFISNTADSRFIYVDYDRPSLVLEDGMTYAHLGLYQEALDSFAQIVDPETLSSKMPVAERVRVEALNNQALALLKSPQKNMEQAIKVWTAGIQEATKLQSSQRFNEAVTIYEIMEAVWPGEKRIEELRELTAHW